MRQSIKSRDLHDAVGDRRRDTKPQEMFVLCPIWILMLLSIKLSNSRNSEPATPMSLILPSVGGSCLPIIHFLKSLFFDNDKPHLCSRLVF